MKRALAKLALTHDVIEGGQFSTASDKADLIADDDYKVRALLHSTLYALRIWCTTHWLVRGFDWVLVNLLHTILTKSL